MDRDRDDRARELEATHARAEKRRATSDATARRTRERNEREGRKNNHAVRARDDEEEEEEDALDARARGQSTISDEVARYFCVADESIGRRRRRRRRRSRAGKSCTFRLDSVGIKSGPSFGRCEDDEDGEVDSLARGRCGVFGARESTRAAAKTREG